MCQTKMSVFNNSIMKKIVCLIIFWFQCVGLHGQEKQPFLFHVKEIIKNREDRGLGISDEDKVLLLKMIENDEDVLNITNVLDKYVLFNVEINAESRTKIENGSAEPILFQNGWKSFLVSVENLAGVTSKLTMQSEQSKANYDGGEKIYGMAGVGKGEVITNEKMTDRWLVFELSSLIKEGNSLSGLTKEYFIIDLYSRDSGSRMAKFNVDCGEGTQDIGKRAETNRLFKCLPSRRVAIKIEDQDNTKPIASLIIRDKRGLIYPNQSKRLAPDFFFQKQIYRYSGEFLDLAEGNYTVEFGRGPEYLDQIVEFSVTDKENQILNLKLERWIKPSGSKWYSGDHHIHAAGCSHYTSPSQGVAPEDMIRHIQGEALNVGSVLTWGQGYDHQKMFFEGKDNKFSAKDTTMRYDLEISGFPSSHAGHLVLLNLKDQYYPKVKEIADWPTYTLPVLRWAKAQGAITGYAHSGLGLQTKSNTLPDFEVPNFDSIGANEYIVAVAHNLVDFISTMDTPPVWELNIWYHTLNSGFRTKISGETDFPCMSDERVGNGRSYVKVDGKLDFNNWVNGLKNGRSYVSEGKSHILDFKAGDVKVGERKSELEMERPGTINVSAKIAALLRDKPDSLMGSMDYNKFIWNQKPFWSIERARIKNTRNVEVELIVNGLVKETKAILADGAINDVQFDVKIDKSSWVAMRIFPSSHTNPIFIIVDNKPIRANKESARWCLSAVDKCWEQKKDKIKESEKFNAHIDYEYAKQVYAKILSESE